MRFKVLLVLLTSGLLAKGGLDAQHLPDTLVLQEVKVPAHRMLAPVSSLPVQQLNALRLQQTGSRSLADALRHFAGLSIRDYGGIGGLKTVNLRSLGAQHTAVYVDDIPMSEAASGQIDLSRITLESTDNVTLSSGGSDDIFRPARWFSLASVISLQSASPDLRSGNTDWKIGITRGAAGLWQPYGRLALRLSEQSSLHAGARYTKASGAYTYRLDNGTTDPQWQLRRNSDVESMAWQSRLSARLGKTSLDWHVLFDHSDRGLPGAVMLYNPWSRQRLSNTDLHQAIVLKGGQQTLRWQSLLKHSLAGLTYNDPDFLNAAGELSQHYFQQEYYFSQLFGGRAGKLHWSASADLVWNRLQADHFVRMPERLSAYFATSAAWRHQRWDISSHLLWLNTFESIQNGHTAPRHQQWSPGFSTSWRLHHDKHARLRFSFKDAFRLPTFNELYYNIVGNPNLKPERARLLNLGLVNEMEISAYKLHYSVDVFLNDVVDKILAIPTKNLFVWSMRNIGRVAVAGWETAIRGERSDFYGMNVYAQMNYSLQYAVDRSAPGSPSFNHQIAYVPRHSLNSFFHLNRGVWSGGVSIYYNSARYFLPENRPENRLNPWLTMDFSASYQCKIAGQPVQIRMDISNLTHVQYEVIRSFPMPGRMLMFTLNTSSAIR